MTALPKTLAALTALLQERTDTVNAQFDQQIAEARTALDAARKLYEVALAAYTAVESNIEERRVIAVARELHAVTAALTGQQPEGSDTRPAGGDPANAKDAGGPGHPAAGVAPAANAQPSTPVPAASTTGDSPAAQAPAAHAETRGGAATSDPAQVPHDVNTTEPAAGAATVVASVQDPAGVGAPEVQQAATAAARDSVAAPTGENAALPSQTEGAEPETAGPSSGVAPAAEATGQPLTASPYIHGERVLLASGQVAEIEDIYDDARTIRVRLPDGMNFEVLTTEEIVEAPESATYHWVVRVGAQVGGAAADPRVAAEVERITAPLPATTKDPADTGPRQFETVLLANGIRGTVSDLTATHVLVDFRAADGGKDAVSIARDQLDRGLAEIHWVERRTIPKAEPVTALAETGTKRTAERRDCQHCGKKGVSVLESGKLRGHNMADGRKCKPPVEETPTAGEPPPLTAKTAVDDAASELF